MIIYFRLLLTIIFSLKVMADLFLEVKKTGESTHYTFNYNKNYRELIPWDDYEIAKSGMFLVQGKGFVTDTYFDRPQFNPLQMHKTALRPKALILLHASALILFAGKEEVVTWERVPEPYFKRYAFAVCLLKNLMLLAALFCFYLVCRHHQSELAALATTLLFLTFPSVLYFVGFTNMIDTVVMPLEVIFFCLLYLVISGNKSISARVALALSLLFLLLCYVKPHHYLVLALLNLSLIFLLVWKEMYNVRLLWVLNLTVLAGTLPIIISNYLDFGEFFLSSQSGFNLFHGHNPVAKGSWTGDIWTKHHKILFPVLESNNLLPSLNEKQESDYYAQLARTWVVDNPVKELVLVVKKVVIYFMPHNFMNWKINLFNLAVYISTFFALFNYVRFWNINNRKLLVFWAPVLGMLIINMLYFVEYRWRYYTEPFMILLCVLILKDRIMIAGKIFTETVKSRIRG